MTHELLTASESDDAAAATSARWRSTRHRAVEVRTSGAVFVGPASIARSKIDLKMLQLRDEAHYTPMLSRQIRSLASIADAAKGTPEIERKVKDATNDEIWGPTGQQLGDICGSLSSASMPSVLTVLKSRMDPSNPPHKWALCIQGSPCG